VTILIENDLKTLEPRKRESLTTEVIPAILKLNRILSGLTFDSLSINTKKATINTKKATPCSNGQLLQS
jgi:hypothetical protein